MSTNKFRSAYSDYKYLRSKEFPEQASLKLVGDRYRLSRIERNSLFRGVMTSSVAESRIRKIVGPQGISGGSLGVDWYNVLISVESYLRGIPLFVADDGVMRDSSSTHGSYRRTGVTEKAMCEIRRALETLKPARVDAFLDSPIAFSAAMAREVRALLAGVSPESRVFLEHSADFALKSYPGIVASSDSVILDSALRVCDLPRYILERSFGFIPPALFDLDLETPSGSARSFEP